MSGPLAEDDKYTGLLARRVKDPMAFGNQTVQEVFPTVLAKFIDNAHCSTMVVAFSLLRGDWGMV